MDTDPLFLPKSGNFHVASGVARVASGPVDADAIERAPGVDTLLEGIQANSQELPAFRKDAFQREAIRHARGAADASPGRMEPTAPAVLLASGASKVVKTPSKAATAGASKTAATIDAETPSSPKFVATAPGSRQKRERYALVVLAGMCALLAGGAVFGGLSMLRGHVSGGEATATSRVEAPNGASLTPHDEALTQAERGPVAVESEAALAALRAEAEAQLAEASTAEEGATEAASRRASTSSSSSPESGNLHHSSRVESTRSLSTVPPRSDISRSQ